MYVRAYLCKEGVQLEKEKCRRHAETERFRKAKREAQKREEREVSQSVRWAIRRSFRLLAWRALDHQRITTKLLSMADLVPSIAISIASEHNKSVWSGTKQNPRLLQSWHWTCVNDYYPPGTQVTGKVTFCPFDQPTRKMSIDYVIEGCSQLFHSAGRCIRYLVLQNHRRRRGVRRINRQSRCTCQQSERLHRRELHSKRNEMSSIVTC